MAKGLPVQGEWKEEEGWNRAERTIFGDLSRNNVVETRTALTPSPSHPMGEGEISTAFRLTESWVVNSRPLCSFSLRERAGVRGLVNFRLYCYGLVEKVEEPDDGVGDGK